MDKCPHCGAWLETVQVEKTVIGWWNYEEKAYEDNGQGNTKIRCYHCGKQLAYIDANQRDTDHIPIGIDELL